eukprot:jgi/Botrbrau1/13453/Bobra.0082s0056.1
MSLRSRKRKLDASEEEEGLCPVSLYGVLGIPDRSQRSSKVHKSYAMASHCSNLRKQELDEDKVMDAEYVFHVMQLLPLLGALPDLQMPLRPALPPNVTRRKTLLLDLDHTLVHTRCVPRLPVDSQVIRPSKFYITGPDGRHWLCRTRPCLHDFLVRASAVFEVIIFTAAHQEYAERICAKLDPSRALIEHCLSHNACQRVTLTSGKQITVKLLSCLGRDLSNIVLVDNIPLNFSYQMDNGIPIRSWYGDPGDEELLDLIPFLEHLAEVPDVRPVIAKTFAVHKAIHTGWEQHPSLFPFRAPLEEESLHSEVLSEDEVASDVEASTPADDRLMTALDAIALLMEVGAEKLPLPQSSCMEVTDQQDSAPEADDPLCHGLPQGVQGISEYDEQVGVSLPPSIFLADDCASQESSLDGFTLQDLSAGEDSAAPHSTALSTAESGQRDETAILAGDGGSLPGLIVLVNKTSQSASASVVDQDLSLDTDGSSWSSFAGDCSDSDCASCGDSVLESSVCDANAATSDEVFSASVGVLAEACSLQPGSSNDLTETIKAFVHSATLDLVGSVLCPSPGCPQHALISL